MIHDKHKAWLNERGFDPVLAEKFGLETVNRNGANWLAVPYIEHGRVVNHKYRQTSQKKHMMDAGAPLCLWNHDVLLAPEVQSGQQSVIITEGEWDALTAIHCGFEHCLSVPNGAGGTEAKLDYLDRSKSLLANVGSFILATDNDAAGIQLREELARRLGPARCKFLPYPEWAKDLNEFYELSEFNTGAVAKLINAAKPYPVQGLYRLSDIPEPPPIEAYSFGIPGLSEHVSIVPGTLTVFTGYASQGKTSLSMGMMANLMKSGMAIAIGSFETMPRPIMQNRLRAAMLGCAEYELARKDLTGVDAILAEKLTVIYQQTSDDDAWDIDQILDLAAGAVIRDGIRLLFLDPWNEIEHKRGSNETETDYTSRALRSIKRFARDYGVAVWIVAHPSKPDQTQKAQVPSLYSIAGSAHWANKPDYGLACHRPDLESNLVDVHVTKVRMGLPGKRGKITLGYDWRSSTYYLPDTGEIDQAA